MIKFDVTNRFFGTVQFTAEIDCTEDAPRSVKLGLAVRWAVKVGADLVGANLAGADLAGANLAGANLAGADLAGADLAGAKIRGDITISKPPIQIHNATPNWPGCITIYDGHMQIGCELHSLPDWWAYDERRIAEMDGQTAVRWWRANRGWLFALATAHGRWKEPDKKAAE